MTFTSWRRIAIAVAFLGVGSVASAQTPDYRRAEQFLGWNTSLMVSGDVVNPSFLPDGNRFWYRNKTTAGSEFVMVDPVANAKRPVFDHARLAAAMSRAKDTAYEPHKLPFTTFNFAGGTESVIEFNASRRRWTCNISAYTCTHGDTLRNVQRYIGSPDSVYEAFASGHNIWIRRKGTNDSTQLTTDGVEYWSYGTTMPRPSQLQNLRVGASPAPPRANLRWSPDSRKIAVYRTDERNVEHMHYISYTPQRPRHFSQPYALPGDTIIPKPNIHIIDIQTKRNIPLRLTPVPAQLQLGGSPLDSMWSKDSKRINFSYLTRASKGMYLFEADAESGAVRMIAGDSAKTWVETNPQGRPSWMVTDDGVDAIWWSERDGFPHLWRVDARTGRIKNQITATRLIDEVHITDGPRARQIYFTGRGRENDLWYGSGPCRRS